MRTHSKFRKRLIFLLTLALLAASSGLGLPLHKSSAQTKPNHSRLSLITPLPAVDDFDGDRLADVAELVSNGSQKHIHLVFGSHWTTYLHFSTETQQTGRLAAGDIDSDNDDDLIWISDQTPIQTVLWLNNGVGEFTRVPDPAPYAAQVERLAPGGGSQGQLASSDGMRLWATATAGSSFSLKHAEQLLYAPEEVTSLPASSWNCLLELASHLACHPKRGPPATLS
ncbi:MAG: hypothetical protein J2P31_19925 [Blastocatellia bacterium]|nr:hypothetical protein [Blastocatellia bacterium]